MTTTTPTAPPSLGAPGVWFVAPTAEAAAAVPSRAAPLATLLGLLAVVVAPLVVGLAAIALALVARARGEEGAQTALLVADLGTFVGVFLAVVASLPPA